MVLSRLPSSMHSQPTLCSACPDARWQQAHGPCVRSLSGREQRKRTGHAACSAQEQLTASLAECTLAAANGCQVQMFGVRHAEAQPHVAEFILRHRPKAVVVETAVNPAHGAVTGSVFSCSANPAGLGFRERMFCGMANHLAALEDPGSSSNWQDIRMQMNGEQLAYIAAFVAGAELVFGDLPKQQTLQRLGDEPSIADLDLAFGIQTASNYQEIIHKAPSVAMGLLLDTYNRIMLTEREAVICQSLSDSAESCGTTPGLVVGVVGEAHMPGIQRLWRTGEWKQLASTSRQHTPPQSEAAEQANNAAWQLTDPAEQAGVRRAILESLMRLHCPPELITELRQVLGPLPAESMPAYQLTLELYGSTRMLLASLSRAELHQVCQGFNCDMWDVLEPVRAVKPSNGGSGCCQDLVADLRTLHFQLS